jgi:hypothetical protein
MPKLVTLTALCPLSHDGKSYGENMQFRATEEEAKRLVKLGQAEVAEDEGRAHKEDAPAPAPATTAAARAASK